MCWAGKLHLHEASTERGSFITHEQGPWKGNRGCNNLTVIGKGERESDFLCDGLQLLALPTLYVIALVIICLHLLAFGSTPLLITYLSGPLTKGSPPTTLL